MTILDIFVAFICFYFWISTLFFSNPFIRKKDIFVFVSLYVPKDLANFYTHIILLYSDASN